VSKILVQMAQQTFRCTRVTLWWLKVCFFRSQGSKSHSKDLLVELTQRTKALSGRRVYLNLIQAKRLRSCES